MKDFFKGVRKHIGRLDAESLREQYGRVSDELARTEKLLHTLKEGIVRLGPDGAVLQANPAARLLLGAEPEQAFAEMTVPLGRSSRSEVDVSYPDPRRLEIQTIPFDDETIVYIRDITAERRRTEEELQAGALDAVGKLAAGLAHEIGNPLNAIALNIQMLERDPGDRESLGICKQQVKRLDGLIRGFLSALRPSRPNLSPGSLAEPVKDCLAAMRQQFEERRIRVTLDVPAALPTVALDRDKMQQVFFNLVKNALEALRDGGEIHITLSSDDREVSAAFADTGAGMTPDQVAHLFEPYRTNKANGTGLGLMICQRIVHDHGGAISAESRPGEGTLFTVRLPRLERRIRQLKDER